MRRSAPWLSVWSITRPASRALRPSRSMLRARAPPAVGLVQEPFVSGIPEMIDAAVRDIPDARQGFVAVFSAGPFPGAQITLERTRAETGGTWYRWAQTGQEGWLCPALFRYFETAPEKLYIQVKPAEE